MLAHHSCCASCCLLPGMTFSFLGSTRASARAAPPIAMVAGSLAKPPGAEEHIELGVAAAGALLSAKERTSAPPIIEARGMGAPSEEVKSERPMLYDEVGRFCADVDGRDHDALMSPNPEPTPAPVGPPIIDDETPEWRKRWRPDSAGVYGREGSASEARASCSVDCSELLGFSERMVRGEVKLRHHASLPLSLSPSFPPFQRSPWHVLSHHAPSTCLSVQS